MPPSPTILFAGGGTGGHLFPGLAIAERLREQNPAARAHFACSDRPLDARILTDAGQPFTPLTVRPLPTRPRQVPAFLQHYIRACREAARLIREQRIAAVVATGGFVSGPAIAAARKLRVPTILVNLDAVPGKANRLLARRCDRIFTVYPAPHLPRRAEHTALPIRRAGLGPADPTQARRTLGLDPQSPVLLITGASQGAGSINDTMTELTRRPRFRSALAGWHVLHLAGTDRAESVERAYRDAELPATVLAFSNQMGLAWGAAELAISRAGAGSVAEVAANAVPTLFLPYPHHRDQHQRLNARPLADAGAALLFTDTADGPTNANRLLDPLIDLLQDAPRRQQMRTALQELNPGDGAAHLAEAALRFVRS